MEEVLEKAALAKVPFDELVERMKLLYEEKESQSDE